MHAITTTLLLMATIYFFQLIRASHKLPDMEQGERSMMLTYILEMRLAFDRQRFNYSFLIFTPKSKKCCALFIQIRAYILCTFIENGGFPIRSKQTPVNYSHGVMT